MNKVIISGRLGAEPELRYTQSGMAVLNFSLAISRGKDKDGNDRGTDWPRCVAFDRKAEMINKWSGKGKRILVEGHLQTGKYTSKSGETHYTTDVYVDRAEIIDWPEQSGQQATASQSNFQRPQPDQGQYQRPQSAPDPQMNIDDIPAGFEELDDDVPF